MQRRITPAWAMIIALGALGGCVAPEPSNRAVATAPAASAASAVATPAVVAPAPPVSRPFDEAVGSAGRRLFEDAQALLGTDSRVLVVDPLIDASTGQQTVATVDMGKLLTSAVKQSHPYWTVKELNRHSLAASPLLVIGTLTAINTKNQTAETADAFRICLRVIDLKSGRVVAKGLSRATVDTVNAEPLPMFRDAPTWHRDRTVAGYIKSCQGTPNIGDTIDPAYLLRLPAAAIVNEAQVAYTENRLANALRLFKEASAVSEPDDLRVLNGMYLTNWRLGKRRDAGKAFHDIAVRGIAEKQLPLKLLFTPGKATPLSLPDLQAQYAMWVRELAQASDGAGACLRVVGHTSRSGSIAQNDALSAERSAYVKERLEQSNAKMRGRITAVGVGARENLIGLGTDDLRDALDRRVEFRVVDCAARA